MSGKRNPEVKESFFSTWFSIIIAIIFYFLAVNISALDPFEKAFKDFSFTDLYYSNKFYQPEYTSQIIIVNVGHHDRAKIAMGIERIAAHKPAVIGVDIVFKDQRQPESDMILKEALLNPSIVSAYYIDEGKNIGNHTYFSSPLNYSGFINFDNDEHEGVVREFRGIKGNSYSFPLQVALKAKAISPDNVSDQLSESLPIRYTGNTEDFLNFDLDEIIASDSIPALNNSIVLMGYLGQNEFNIEDKHFTPMNPKHVGKSIPDMHGVIIHANIIKMLMEDNFLLKIPKFISYTAAFLICWLLTFLIMSLHKRNELGADIMVKVLQLLIVIITVYFALFMLHSNIYIWVTPILVLAVLGLELIPFYHYFRMYLSKRFLWKS